MAVFSLPEKRPVLPADGRVFVADCATVIGDVVLGEESSVWFGAVLRGDNDTITIGARTSIQDQCMLHVDPGFPLDIGDDCSIGHRAILHGCTIGSGTLVGMGSIIMNGARIGRHCLVGAGTLVTEGKEFPDNALVIGSPARLARTLSPEQAEAGRLTASSYVRHAELYRTAFRRL